MRSSKYLFMVIAFIAIGFASISTTLIINGTFKINSNPEDFDIYFSKVSLNSLSKPNFISDDGHNINFTTDDLKKVGDRAIIDYEITNNSRNYDAQISISCDYEANAYLTIENSFKKRLTEATHTESGALSVTLNKASIEEREYMITCTIEATAIEREEIPKERCRLITGDGTNIGDMVRCGGEQFYIIEITGEKIKMLSQYNLLVGNQADYQDEQWIITPLPITSGIQDVTAGAWHHNGTDYITPFIGVTKFGDSVNFEESYLIPYLTDYQNYLTNNFQVGNMSISIISKEELVSLGCSVNGNSGNCLSSPYPWVYTTSYWTKTPSEEVPQNLWLVDSNGGFNGYYNHNYQNYGGVRPVVTLTTDVLKS